MDPDLCIKCRGIKLLCGLDRCPYIDYSYLMPKISNEYKGISPPDIFVGHHGYPKVLITALSSNGEVPLNLFPMDLDSILRYRGSLYRVGEVQRVDKGSKLIEKIQEISLSEIKLGIDAEYYKVIGDFTIDHIHTPLGPRLYAKRIDLVENPIVPNIVERVYGDYDFKADKAIYYLYKNNLPYEYLRRLFSAGILGLKVERRIVPTRWAITAVDDIIGKKLIDEIKQNEDLDSPIYAHGNYMWNDFFILIMPGEWGFEMIENWYGRNLFSREMVEKGDYETFFGRRGYASNVTGAYYAARLGILEYLKSIGKRGSAIVYRVIGMEYRIPLGVWIIRETVREALRHPFILNGKNIKEFHIIPDDIKYVFESSRTIKRIKEQKRIDNYG